MNVTGTHRYKALLAGILLLLCGLPDSRAQTVKRTAKVEEHLIKISEWKIEDGLPFWNIFDMIRDGRGHLWLLGQKGLCRFDGRKFILYQQENAGIPSLNPLFLAEDVHGNIWLVHINRDRQSIIHIFLPDQEKTLTFEEYTGRPQPSLPPEPSRFFHTDYGLYFFTAAEGWCYDGTFREIFSRKVAPGRLMPGPGKKTWRWTPERLELIDSTGKVSRAFPGLPFQRLQADAKGDLWAFISPSINPPHNIFHLSEKGIDTIPPDRTLNFSPANTRFFYRSPPRPSLTTKGYRIHAHQENQLGLYFQEQELIPSLTHWLLETHKIQLASNSFFYLGEPGVLWIPTVGGLLRLEFQQLPFEHHLARPYLSTSVRGMTTAGPHGIAACTYKGLFLLSPNGEEQRLTLPKGIIPFSLFWQDGYLWVGDHQSQWHRYDLDRGKHQSFGFFGKNSAREIHTITDVPGQGLVAGTPNGLWRLDEEQNKLIRIALPDTSVHCFFKQNDEIWIGTGRGLMHWNSRQFFPFFPAGENSSPTSVFHLQADEKGDLWIATQRGLVQWSPFSEQHRWYTSEDGLPPGRLHAVYPDASGRLWISSNNGLARFHPASGRCQTYFEKDGLTHSEFNFLAHHADPGGRLYFGGVNGITSFHPADITSEWVSFTKRDLLLEEVHLLKNRNRLRPEGFSRGSMPAQLRIPPNIQEARLSFSYPFYDQVPLQFEWRLSGAEKEWQPSEDLAIRLYKIPYGKNRLEVRVFPKGNPQNTLASTSLLVYGQRPFYLRWYFFLGAGLLLLGLLWSGIKWREKAIKTQNRLLRQKVAERTAELEQKTDRLQQLMQAKDQLFTNISHEFRTPLSLILGHTELLQKEKKENNGQADHVSAIRNQSLQLKEMTEEILDLARLETDEVKVLPALCEWPGFLRQLWRQFTPQAEGKKLTYLLQVTEEEEKLIFIDKIKVTRVVNNLIANALKYTPAGGEVKVRGELRHDTVFISVQDSGSGIPPEELPYIFERYYQGREGAKSGFGIGLSLSRAYAELMGGTLTVESEKGRGSCFCFRIPLAEAPIPDAPEPEIPALAPSGAAANLAALPGKAHLLVVEDHEAMLQFLVTTLGEKYNLSLARNGREALELLKQQPEIDLVISDIMMPVMDGFSLLSAIRKDPRLQGLPILLLTAMVEEQTRKQAYLLGVDGFLPKPFEWEELAARVESMLRNLAARRKHWEAAPVTILHAGESEAPPSFDQIWLKDLQEMVQRRLSDSNLKVGDLARALNISERTLRNRLKSYTGLSPSQYLQKARLEKALQYLQHRRYATVAEVCYAVGLQNTAHFARIFQKAYGKLPSDYLK